MEWRTKGIETMMLTEMAFKPNQKTFRIREPLLTALQLMVEHDYITRPDFQKLLGYREEENPKRRHEIKSRRAGDVSIRDVFGPARQRGVPCESDRLGQRQLSGIFA